VPPAKDLVVALTIANSVLGLLGLGGGILLMIRTTRKWIRQRVPIVEPIIGCRRADGLIAAVKRLDALQRQMEADVEVMWSYASLACPTTAPDYRRAWQELRDLIEADHG